MLLIFERSSDVGVTGLASEQERLLDVQTFVWLFCFIVVAAGQLE